MTELWNSVCSPMCSAVREGFEAVKGNGQYPALFLVSLIALAFYKDKREKQYWYYGILTLFLLLFPPAVWILMKYQTGFYTAGSLWALAPITGMTAYGAVALLDMAEKKAGHWDNGRRKYALAGIFCLVILLAAGAFPVPGAGEAAENEKKIPLSQQAVLEWIAENVEEPCLWAPREVMEYARACSGDIRLVYGRNLWEEALNAYTYDTYDDEHVFLYAWMEGQLAGTKENPLENMQLAVETAAGRGCNVLVLRAGDEWARAETECVDDMGYLEGTFEAGDYLILTLHLPDASRSGG